MLAQPENENRGVIGWRIKTLARPEPNIDADRLVRELLDAGLIERHATPDHKMAKPYFITPSGSEYLRDAEQRAIFPELFPKEAWTAEQSRDETQQAIAEVIRQLPEFSSSGDARIEEVSRVIAQAVTPAAGRDR